MPAATYGAIGRALFADQAALYAQHRPTYPLTLFRHILEFAALEQRQTALDVACGTGQVAAALAGQFQQVLACDSTAAQLAAAAHAPNLRYFQAPAERLPQVANHSIDLATAAQCLHWFDVAAFYTEMRRVLRPGGTLAIWGYAMPSLASPPGQRHDPAVLARLRRSMQQLQNGTLGGYWDDRRWYVDNCYMGLEPGLGQFGTVQRLEGLSTELTISVAGLGGYIRSWSSYSTYRQRHPGAPDPAEPFLQQVKAELGIRADGGAARQGADSQPALRLVWPLFGWLAKHPLPLAQPGGAPH